MYSTRATSGSRPLIPPASVLPPPAAVLTPPDSSFLHRRIPDSRLIVAPQVPHITIQFLQGKGSLDLFSLDLPLPASCESASVQGSPLQPPTLINNEEWFDVEDILDSRIFCRKLQYKVKWMGSDYEDASWEPVENVAHARDLIHEFYCWHPDALKQVYGMFFMDPAVLRAPHALRCIEALHPRGGVM
ncbi:putative integrase core domain containing protein [Lyophyllum shimeji]|uniref:Integrase core domain containing protein n=1 Tax=Lyophyllum shimeji TaxID=47721 RepID=A0A9P3UMN3_LYOSH|nr:putative integrase core domain containing protein [Lyophyllum shimeji]